MSKTNHRRTGDRPRKDSDRYAGSPMGGTGRASPIAGVHVCAGWGGDNSGGHRGYAGAKAGAKKYVNSRIRHSENQAVRAAVRMPDHME